MATMPKVRRLCFTQGGLTTAAQTHFNTNPRLLEKARLLASVKAIQAMKNFEKSLFDLCLQTIARNEAIFTTEQGKAAVQRILSPRAKTRLLAELGRPVFEGLRYPASEHRFEMIKSLVHEQLDEFDFSVLGYMYNESYNEQVWWWLAKVAGQSLRTLRDERVNNGYENLYRYLPYLAQMPHLQKLQLTGLLCSNRAQLLSLATAVPRLESLKLNLENRCTNHLISALHSLKALKELEFYGKQGANNFDAAHEVPAMLLRVMPWLKVNCFRSDQLDVGQSFVWYDAEDCIRLGPFGLEHVTLIAHESLNSQKQFPNVRHVLLVQTFVACEDFLVDCPRVFPHLSSINLKFWDFRQVALPLLARNGAGITTLILDTIEDPQDGPILVHHLINLESVLTQCTNLTSLTVRGGKLDKTGNSCYGVPGRIGLRELFLLDLDTRDDDSDALLWLISAPMLEELTLKDFATKRESFNFAKREVENGTILTNLKKFKISLYDEYPPWRWGSKRTHQESVRAFVQAALCFCPKLQEVAVKLDFTGEEGETMGQLVDLVNS